MTARTGQDLAEAFLEARDAFGVAVTLGSQTIQAIADESEFARDLVEGGFRLDAEVRTKVLLSDLTTLPSLGTAATYDGQSFRVSRVAITQGGLIGEFTLTPRGR
jgi:hypothetical protein